MDYSCNVCLTELKITLLLSQSQQSISTIHTKRAYLTNCKHIYCQLCIQKVQLKCLICKKDCRSIEINDKLPPTIRFYFESFGEHRRNLLNYMKFVNDQQNIRMEQLKYFYMRYKKYYEDERKKCTLIKQQFDNGAKNRNELIQIIKYLKKGNNK